MKFNKKFASAALSIALSGAMVLSTVPIQVKAAQTGTETTAQKGYDGTISNEYTPGGGKIYYVDSSNGDDTKDGLTEATAFKSLGKVNQMNLDPGDSILLKKGSVFEKQQLAPKGKGTEEKHILIATYGESNEKMPVINTRFEYREAILIENMEYVDITGIEVTNDDKFNETSQANDPNNSKGTDSVNGKKFRPLGVHILINEDAPTIKSGTEGSDRVYKGINLDGCYIHDVDGDENYNTNKLSGGIGIEIKYRNSNNRFPVFDGVTIQNNRIDQVDRCGIKAIRLTELDQNNRNGEEVGGDGERYAGARRQGKNQASLNYVVRNNYLTDIGGDGILVDSTRGALVENNLLYNHTMRATGANAGIWSWNAFDTIFQYNESYGGPVSNQDGCSYDSDYFSAGTIFQYNYSHDCKLGFMLIMGGNDTDIIRYNLSQNDGNVWRHIAGNGNTPSYVYNNVFYYNGENWRFVNNNAADTNQNQSIRNNWQYFNNIFYNTSTTKTSNWKIGDWDNAVVGTNMVYEASGNYADNEIPNAIHADPMFVDPGKGASRTDHGTENIWSSLDCYKLKENSPAIGAGTFVNVVPQTTGGNANCWDYTSDRNATVDFYGNKLYNGAPDIGLDESNQKSKFSVQKNAIYRIMNPESSKYLTMTPTETGAVLEAKEKEAENQTFIIVGSGSGYKVKAWDDSIPAYRYLAVENGVPTLSSAEETVWELVDIGNGFFGLKNDGKLLTCDGSGLKLEVSDAETDPKAQWHMQMEEESHSYNVGGEEIEGFSADQSYNAKTRKSGSYEEVEKFEANSQDGVYKTGVKGENIGYKMYASNGEYTLRLFFARPSADTKTHTMNVLVNGKTVLEAYELNEDTASVTLSGIKVTDGLMDVKVQSAYGSDGTKEQAVLSGISAEKQIYKEIQARINAGNENGQEVDGLSPDVPYSNVNGAGYYTPDGVTSEGKQVTNTIEGGFDAGMTASLKTARVGSEFGYKIKAMSGNYRVKLYFATDANTDYKFDIVVNGKTVKEGFDIKTEAGGANKGVAFVYETEAENGYITVDLKGVESKQAAVSAVIVEAYERPEGENLAISNVTAASQQNGKEGQKAFDKNQATRWASDRNNTDGQKITFELDEQHILNGIVLDWTPNAMAKDYHIDISSDGQEWTPVATVTDAKRGLNVHSFDEGTVAKYIRVTCDQKLNEWAISLTEAEIYGGAAVKGAASTTAAVKDVAEDTTQVTAGMGYIYKRYSTAAVTFQYDPKEVQYVADSFKTESTDNLDAMTETEVNAGDGVITQRYGMKKWNGFQEADTPVASVQFKNLTGKMAKVEVAIALTSSDGHITELPVQTVYLPEKVSFALLTDILTEANELKGSAEPGTDKGQYPQESIDSLGSAVTDAQKVTSSSSEEEMKNAAIQLYEAIKRMENTQVKRTKVMYHKDFNNPNEKAPAVSAGESIVEDGAWKLTLGTDAIAKITEAEAINSGYYYVKFKVSDAGDQTIFGVLGDEDVRRIRIGYDAGKWFYDGSLDGYGYWPQASLTANTPVEMMLKFNSSNGNTTPATLWINGVNQGDQTLSYTSGTGIPSIQTRRTAKTYSIEEIYFTNSEPVTINVSSTGNGSVSQTGAVTSFIEADKTFYFTPESGVSVKSVKVDGQEVEWNKDNNSYTFEYLQKGHTLAVEFGDGQTEEPKPVETVTYHKDYMVDSTANYKGNLLTSSEVKDNALNLVLGDGTANVFAVAMDQEAPSLSEGTFYTRFVLDNVDDQMLFDLKTDGTSNGSSNGYIRIGYETDSIANRAAWFFDKEMGNTQGWGDFPNQTAQLEPGKEHEVKIDFKKAANGTYSVTLTVDGQSCGTVDNLNYGSGAGKFAFASRKEAKNIQVKEVYYTNAAAHKITVTAGEGGAVSQTGMVTVFEKAAKTLFVTPNEGYVVDTVRVNGTQVSLTNGSYTFSNVTEDQTFDVTFKAASQKPDVPTVNKAELESVYNQYKDTQKGNAPDNVYEEFRAALQNAADKLTSETATQDEVNKAKTDLEKAFDKLEKSQVVVPTVNKTELQASYDQYKDTQKGNAPDNVYEEFRVALQNAADKLASGTATQDEVNKAKTDLEKAFDKLEKSQVIVPTVNKTELQVSYDQYKDIQQGSFSEDLYAEFTAALQKAEKVLASGTATQDEVVNAKEELEAAYKKLISGGDDKPDEGDKKPEDDTKDPVDDGKKPVDDSKKPVDDTKKPVDDTKKPENGTKKPAAQTGDTMPITATAGLLLMTGAAILVARKKRG